MKAIIIEEGSEAFDYLRRAMAEPSIHKISLDVRSDGVAIKANEYAWTPTLSTEPKRGRA